MLGAAEARGVTFLWQHGLELEYLLEVDHIYPKILQIAGFLDTIINQRATGNASQFPWILGGKSSGERGARLGRGQINFGLCGQPFS